MSNSNHVLVLTTWIPRAFVAWLVLLSIGTWTAERWGNWRWTHYDVPLLGGNSLHVHIGDRFARRSLNGMYLNRLRPQDVRTPMRINIWYRANGGLGSRVLDVPLPVWPLLALTGGTTLLVVGYNRLKQLRHLGTRC